MTDLGFYLHVPFCAARCGYCDFNTYTSQELGGGGNRAEYPETAAREIRQAAKVLERFTPEQILASGRAGTGGGAATGDTHAGRSEHSLSGRRDASAGANLARRVSTVFFGGGTPTLLPATELARLLGEVSCAVGIEKGAEVTTEANPDSVDERYLESLAAAGFTRVSLGMQSAVPHVLGTLNRTHDPANVRRAVAGAKRASLDVSLDLIYGTPGETEEDWRHSLREAIQLEPDHISAYALGIEPGTRMGREVARGLIPGTDSDDQAAKYLIADQELAAAGYRWYEISNWARPGQECRHNLGYWRGANWWGIGPGAHSHLAGVRWWNVKHPRTYAARLAAGELPIGGAEQLSAQERELERVMLGLRLRGGIASGSLTAAGLQESESLVAEGLIDPAALQSGRIQLTLSGRLQADGVTRRLTD